MTCIAGIVKNLASTCETQGIAGMEVKVWVWNRADVTIAFDATKKNMITGLTQAATKKAYVFTGIGTLMNVGSDVVVAADRAKRWTHYFSFQQFETLAEDLANVDAMDDIVVVVELLNKTLTGEGTFMCYGAKSGLYVSSDTHRVNENTGARNIEATNKEGQTETASRYPVFITSYADTLAALEALETVLP